MKSRYTNVKYHCEISWYFSVHRLPQSLRNYKEEAKIKPSEKALAMPGQWNVNFYSMKILQCVPRRATRLVRWVSASERIEMWWRIHWTSVPTIFLNKEVTIGHRKNLDRITIIKYTTTTTTTTHTHTMGGANSRNQEKWVNFQAWVHQILKKGNTCILHYLFPFICSVCLNCYA